MAYRTQIDLAIRPEGEGWVSRYPRREPLGQPVEQHVGICLHYDASGSDRGSVAWFRDPRAAGVGYTFLILDDGRTLQYAPFDAWVFHAGICRPSGTLMEHGSHYRDANRALYGVSIAATDGDIATAPQLLAVAGVCFTIFQREGWDLSETWRITSHSAEAWPRGRKIDSEGSNPARPVLDPDDVRFLMPTLIRAA